MPRSISSSLRSFTCSLVNIDVDKMNSPRILQLPRRVPSIRQCSSPRSSPRNLSTGAQQKTSAPSSPWTRRLIYGGIFGSLGIGAGKLMEQRIAPPPIPGSPEDQKQLQTLQRAYEIGLPIVQQLRDDPDYVESDVYEYFSDEQKKHRLTSGPMAGSRGLGLQVCLITCMAASTTSVLAARSQSKIPVWRVTAEAMKCRTSGSRLC